MISASVIVLSDDLIWENEFDSPVTAQQVKVTLGGHTIVSSSPLIAGEEINLTARSSGSEISGYYTREQIIQLKVLERTQETFELVYGNQTFESVLVKAGGVLVSPAIPRPDQDVSDWYSGTVTFINKGA